MRCGIFLVLAGLAMQAVAKPVELVLPNKVVAKAEFRNGEVGKPAILLMHGFLQTHEFPTIHRLVEGLSSEGYSVLAPTLTLGVSHRKQSLACEAINVHSMADATMEVGLWVEWLKARKMSSVVLLGHSFGSVVALAYLGSQRQNSVDKLIGVSAAEGRLKSDRVERDKLIDKARALVKSNSRSLMTEQLSFCQKYRATPAGMLSYLEWTPERLLREVRRLPTPTTFIMGSRDDRLGPGWIEHLKQTRAKVLVIEGANHFMDGDFEFDLLDTVLAELKTP
jgi:pimeloyl-ACP methyl ester carboxylesterase